MPAPTFRPDVVAAVCRHMNDDHSADALLICRALGGVPDAVSAEAVDVDATAMRFRVQTAAGEEAETSVAFATPARERADVRTAVVELYERACAAAGVPPRAH